MPQLTLFNTSPEPARVESPLEQKIRKVLGPKVPEGAIDVMVVQAAAHPVSIRVVKSRTSKAGDFRPPHNGAPPAITVNGSLNPYAFLITLVHELAHHRVDLGFRDSMRSVSLRRRRRPLPHGEEWKAMFRELMTPYLNDAVFPPEVLPVLRRAMVNPKASSSADHKLSRVLAKYDPPDNSVRLEELPFDALFALQGRRVFRKKEKVRTRFRCICAETNRVYLVSANAPVQELSPEM